MFRHFAFALLALAGFTPSAGAQVDINLHNLLTALTQGTEVTLLTPATNGMVQVTSFVPSQRFSGAEAAALVEGAQRWLGERGVARPTGEQLASALIEQLPPASKPAGLRSEVVFTTALPQLIAAPLPTR
jgi:hypothetical protein